MEEVKTDANRCEIEMDGARKKRWLEMRLNERISE